MKKLLYAFSLYTCYIYSQCLQVLSYYTYLSFLLQSVTSIIETLRKPVLDIEADSNQLGNRKSNVYKKLGFEVNYNELKKTALKIRFRVQCSNYCFYISLYYIIFCEKHMSL